MTLIREDAALEAVEPDEPAVVGTDVPPDEGVTVARTSWKRVVAIALLGALAAGVTVALFTGPVERIWYRNRQHQLASDMNAPRAGVAPGQAIAVLQVPRLGVNVVVIEGDNPERLRSGPGHRVGTARPGTRGNSLIVGHRSAWGGPFGSLARVRKGDLIAVQTRAKKTVVYKVTAVAAVGGSDTRLLQSTKDYRLTLVTGRGGRFSDDRLVVSAISGTRAKGQSSARPIEAQTPSQSVIFNVTILLALVAFTLAIGAAIYLRRRESGVIAKIVVVAPLVAAGTLCLLLDLDLLLPPLN
jgi:LPXTG-site transpeptidase (sortase) family protein